MVIIHTPTNNLANSRSFYEKLQFQPVDTDKQVLYTDGKVVIEINPDRYARAGIKIYREDWAPVTTTLQTTNRLHPTANGWLTSDPNGVFVYLEEQAPPKLKLPEHRPAIPGNFAGISLETTDMEQSATFWQKLGYEVAVGGSGQSWMTLSDGGLIPVSLMKPLVCPHLFFNPSLTYFNGKDNPAIIAKVRKTGLPIAEEITYFNPEGQVDNIILRDPGGYGFFLFND